MPGMSLIIALRTSSRRWPNFSVPLRREMRFFCGGLAMVIPVCLSGPYDKTGAGVTPIPVSYVNRWQ